METYHRLEYSEDQGFFHFNNVAHEKNSFGWVCLSETLRDDKCMEFVIKMTTKYKNINTCNGLTIPSINQIKNEFELFLKINNGYKKKF